MFPNRQSEWNKHFLTIFLTFFLLSEPIKSFTFIHLLNHQNFVVNKKIQILFNVSVMFYVKLLYKFIVSVKHIRHKRI